MRLPGRASGPDSRSDIDGVAAPWTALKCKAPRRRATPKLLVMRVLAARRWLAARKPPRLRETALLEKRTIALGPGPGKHFEVGRFGFVQLLSVWAGYHDGDPNRPRAGRLARVARSVTHIGSRIDVSVFVPAIAKVHLLGDGPR